MNIFKLILKIFIVLIIVLAVLIGYAYFIEPNLLKTKKQVFKLDCLGSDISSHKFVQISDLHFTEKTNEARINKIYQAVKKLNPEIVFITGDFVSKEIGIKPATNLVGKLTKDFPVYAVFGNWDYWALNYDINRIENELEKVGAEVAINESFEVQVGDELINIIGVKDPYTSGQSERGLKWVMDNIDKNNKSCKILLAHSPDIIKTASELNIDLVLVGHTHGGQIHIPFITPKLIPVRPEGKGYIKGLYTVNQTQMYVNRGLGMSIWPFRFMVSPEITLISLEKL